MARVRKGRASMFRDKKNGVRVQGIITKPGAKDFEVARRKLEALFHDCTGEAQKASDADVIEFLARGRQATEVYFGGIYG